MAYFDCIVGGSGKGNTLVVTCADELAGATITCTNGTKTYTKTCPSTAPYEVTFYGLMAGTWTVSATVGGNTYTTTVVVVDCAALLGGFNWRTWVDTASQLDSSDYNSLDEVLEDELAIRELCLEHACVDYMAEITTNSADVETIINTDLFAKWVNNSDYALDFLHANQIIADYMDEADKYGYGEWVLMPQVPKMTANDAPYGEVIATNSMVSSHYAYLAFDGDDSTEAYPSSSSTEARLGFRFYKPVEINSFYIKMSASYTNVCVLSYSDDGINWVDTNTSITLEAQGIATVDVDASYGKHSYWSIRFTSTTAHYHGVYTLQFYAYAPKGNVPIMTSDTAPYGEVIGSTPYQSYYRWQAFKSPQTGTTSFVTTTISNAFIGYRFTNPVCVRKVRLSDWDGGSSYKCSTVYHYKIQASNDGFVNDIHDLATGENEYQVNTWGGFREYTFDNDNYYMYYRYLMVDVFPSGKQKTAFVIATLQFYGRELKVSVPSMTSNTSPFGVVSSDDSVATSRIQNGTATTNSFWILFQKQYTDAANNRTYSDLNVNKYVQYEFPNPIVPKVFVYDNNTDGATYYLDRIEIQASKDGVTNWESLGVFTSGAGAFLHHYCSFNDDNEEYKAVRIYNRDTRNSVSFGTKANIFGFDYSEKEFEEGSTKKWLYDHGVELEPMTLESYGATAIKESDGVYLYDTGTDKWPCFYFGVSVANYDLIRAKLGEKYYDNGTIRVSMVITTMAGESGASTTAKYTYNTHSEFPNDIYSDISSDTTSNYVRIAERTDSGQGTGYTKVVELWLE